MKGARFQLAVKKISTLLSKGELHGMALGTLSSWLLEMFKQRPETFLSEKGCNYPGVAESNGSTEVKAQVSVPLSKALPFFGSQVPHLSVIVMSYQPSGRGLDPVNPI